MSPSSPSRITFPKSHRTSHPGATAVGKTNPGHTVTVSVIVKRKSPLDLASLGGRHLSQEEFSQNYAADPASFAQVRAFAHNHGLAVDENASSLARRTVVLRGPASKMEEAFGVQLDDYQQDGKTFHSYTGTLSMPAEHAAPVEAIMGLDCHPIARPHFRIYDHKKKKKPTHPKPGPSPTPAQASSFNPPQVAQLYGFPSGVNGAGQTIGIIELGGGYNASDLSAYFSGLGIAEPKVTAVSVDGGTNSPGNPNGADGEVALDIEVAGSIAPGANIAVYFTTNTSQGFLDALTTALHDTNNGPPSVISISWGSEESNYTAQSLTAFDEACQSAAALGITITVASGDNGSTDGGTGNNVDFPASSPHVLGCGGTELTASGTTISEEIVWNDQPQGGASGGGVSAVFHPAHLADQRQGAYGANQRRRTRRTRCCWRCLSGNRLQRKLRRPERSRRRHQRRRSAVGRADRPAQPAARQQPRLHQPDHLRQRRKWLQRHHSGKQRRLVGWPRMGPVHRPRLAERRPVGNNPRLAGNRLRKIA